MWNYLTGQNRPAPQEAAFELSDRPVHRHPPATVVSSVRSLLNPRLPPITCRSITDIEQVRTQGPRRASAPEASPAIRTRLQSTIWPTRPPIAAQSVDVDLSDPVQAEAVAVLFAQSFRQTKSPAAYYMGALNPRTMTAEQDRDCQHQLAEHFLFCNDELVRGGAEAKAFVDAENRIIGVCIFTASTLPAGVDRPVAGPLTEEAQTIAEYDADTEQTDFQDALFDIWGEAAALRFMDLARDTTHFSAREFDGRTLSIDMCCAAPERIGSGIGREMLRQILSDPAVTRDAEYVMAVTYMNPDFWSGIGMKPTGPSVRAQDIQAQGGGVVSGVETTCFKARIVDVLAALRDFRAA